jgi:glycosyltransferase involved in cell wall biosynthesis
MATLAVCLVVKNGRKTVLSCLDSIATVADEVVVVDTGSVDGTVELARAWGARNRKPMVVDAVGSRFHDSDGNFDFGAAKNHAIGLAKSDYVMWIDANETVEQPPRLRKAFEVITARSPDASIYIHTRTSPKYFFPRLRICKRKNARFEGRIHELLINGAPNPEMVDTGLFIKNFKPSRDVARNLKTLLADWEKGRTPRTAFYVANSYRDMKDYANALEWYCVAVDEFPDNFTEERVKSLEMICQISELSSDMPTIGARAKQLISECPNRPEGYYWRGKYQYAMGNYSMAEKCMRMCLKLNFRPDSVTWINPDIYDRKKIVRMLREARDKSTFLGMKPMRPDNIRDYGPGLGQSRVEYQGYGY